MDSGNNSGSLQSSSGADEEYDSRADTISAFMTTGPIPTPPVFDPLLSNYLQLYHNSNTTTPLLNSTTWATMPTTLRSDPNSHNIINNNNNPMFPAPPPNFTSPSFRLPDSLVGTNDNNNNNNNNLSSALPPQGQSQNQGAAGTVRNSKKRSRASRRAPTTVLTTDTNNFRAMVQEFTGIPAPPFNTSSPFPRTRLDFLGTRSSTSSFDAVLQPPASYLRRPFAQKVQSPPPPPPSFLGTSNTNNSTVVVSSTNPASLVNSSPSPSINYQQSSNLFNNIFPNPLANSLLQANPRFPFSNFIKPQQGSSFGNLGFDGFGNNLTPTLISGLPNLISSDQNEHNKDCNNRNAGDEAGMRPVVGNYGYSRNTTSGEKGSENVVTSSTRGEGMVESWICSSD